MISLSEAKMLHEGQVIVRGKVMACSRTLKMISSTKYFCSNSECGYYNEVRHPRPLLLINDKESNNKCPCCQKQAVSTKLENINAVEIELQDVDRVNEIDRLVVYLFGNDNIKSIRIGETVIIGGKIHVINKNENKSRKRISALYGNSIFYENEKKIELTDKDVEYIEKLKDEKGEGWNRLPGFTFCSPYCKKLSTKIRITTCCCK